MAIADPLRLAAVRYDAIFRAAKAALSSRAEYVSGLQVVARKEVVCDGCVMGSKKKSSILFGLLTVSDRTNGRRTLDHPLCPFVRSLCDASGQRYMRHGAKNKIFGTLKFNSSTLI